MAGRLLSMRMVVRCMRFLLRVLDGSLSGSEQTGKFTLVPINSFMYPSITQETSKEKDNFEVYSERRLPLLRLILEPRYSNKVHGIVFMLRRRFEMLSGLPANISIGLLIFLLRWRIISIEK